VVKVITDIFGREIRLDDGRWKHIITVHPEIERYRKEVEETVSNPDKIKRSLYSNEVVIYYRQKVLNGKHMAVVIKVNDDKFVITAYMTDRIKEGEMIWQRS